VAAQGRKALPQQSGSALFAHNLWREDHNVAHHGIGKDCLGVSVPI
jgi:hypothetical protein